MHNYYPLRKHYRAGRPSPPPRPPSLLHPPPLPSPLPPYGVANRITQLHFDIIRLYNVLCRRIDTTATRDVKVRILALETLLNGARHGQTRVSADHVRDVSRGRQGAASQHSGYMAARDSESVGLLAAIPYTRRH